MNTGQTVYEQLQEILNKCIELGWLHKIFDKGCYILEDGVYRDKGRIPMFSFHDLFSKDSGIMEFVEWKINEHIESITINEYGGFKYDVKRSPYYEISDMTAEEKCNYFVNNAIIPKP